MQVIPRIYQRAAAQAALKGLRGRLTRALVVFATGLGKTLTAALIAKLFRAKRILFLVHNNFILEHAVNEFRLVFSKKTRMAIYNSMSKNGATEADIVFATWQTMGKSMKEWARNHFNLIIVDEAHHSEADTYKPVLKYFTAPKLGITATPDREDEADIREVFGPEVINVTLEEAIARGWLPRIEYHIITDESLDENALQEIVAEIREGKKRFTMAEVNRRIFIMKRNEEIAKIINAYNQKAVVFCASIVHAERMVKSLGLAETFHSNKGNGQKDTWNKNQETLDNLKNGVIRRVCAVNAFNEGVNVPSVGLVAFCRVTGVLTIFRQQLGRGLRPGKDKLIVLDFVGNLERIQLVLKMMNKISDLHEKYTPRGEMEREGYTRQHFEVSGKGFEFTFSDKVVDLMKVLEHCEREFYPTWQEASVAARKLGIKSQKDYVRLYKNDPRLPSAPSNYPGFPGLRVFLTGKDKEKFYPNWTAASKASKRLGFTTAQQYRTQYKCDPRLPSTPEETYTDFPGWLMFIRGETKKEYYPSWQVASKAVLRLGICSQSQYHKRYKKDPFLPSNPQRHYKDFPNWIQFLGKK
jgi:superfamily II DNA or RNA helicase